MGCSPSTLLHKRPTADAADNEPAPATAPAPAPTEAAGLHAFVPKANYVRPSFQAAYARAIRRYRGAAPTFAFRADRVVQLREEGATHEVPAESIQNECVCVLAVLGGC
jgi:hypothetical protein